jgi:hypothetical protein
MADGPIDNYSAKGTYKGPLANLKGKTADLVVYRSTGRCTARFHDPATGYANGGHDFPADNFNITNRED